ncbi:hypothetical protein BDV10DRAFT_154155 [Aspergillus recurvatus]
MYIFLSLLCTLSSLHGLQLPLPALRHSLLALPPSSCWPSLLKPEGSASLVVTCLPTSNKSLERCIFPLFRLALTCRSTFDSNILS